MAREEVTAIIKGNSLPINLKRVVMTEFSENTNPSTGNSAESVMDNAMSVEVRPSIVLFWLRTKLSVTPKGISGSVPNTILGLIPLGSRDLMYPMKQVSGVQVNTKFSIVSAILGGICLIAGFASNIFIFFIPAAILLGNAYTAQVIILNTGNGKEIVKATWLDKAILESYANKVRAILHDM